jgi:hypothetical protein
MNLECENVSVFMSTIYLFRHETNVSPALAASGEFFWVGWKLSSIIDQQNRLQLQGENFQTGGFQLRTWKAGIISTMAT